MRRLLARQRLYGTKVGFVWAIYPDDLNAFKRMRRPPGRPRKFQEDAPGRAAAAQIAGERIGAGTDRLLRRPRRKRRQNGKGGRPRAR